MELGEALRNTERFWGDCQSAAFPPTGIHYRFLQLRRVPRFFTAFRMTVRAGSKSRNADFIFIAAKRLQRLPYPPPPTAAPPSWGRRLWLFAMQHLLNKSKFRNAVFILIARRAVPSPLNPLNLLNPLNPHAAGVSRSGDTFPMSVSEHNPSTQPAAAGGHNLQPRRGWPPSPSEPSEPGPRSGPIIILTLSHRGAILFHIQKP